MGAVAFRFGALLLCDLLLRELQWWYRNYSLLWKLRSCSHLTLRSWREHASLTDVMRDGDDNDDDDDSDEHETEEQS